MVSPDAAREIACPMVAQAVDFVLQLLPSSPWTPSTYHVAPAPARKPDCKPFGSATICRFACICGIAPGVPIGVCDPQPASIAVTAQIPNAWRPKSEIIICLAPSLDANASKSLSGSADKAPGKRCGLSPSYHPSDDLESTWPRYAVANEAAYCRSASSH